MKPFRVLPWQLWWANFDPQIGREQAGRRPCVVVGTELACSLPNRLAIVAPMTRTDRSLPFHPRVVLGKSPGFVMLDQVKSISHDRLVGRHQANLTPAEIETIRFALRQLIDVG